MAALDAVRSGQAVLALQRVLAVQPNNAPARAELARAYALAGDIDTARAEFATVVDDPSLPDPVRQRFTGFVRQFDKQLSGGGSDVSGFFDVREIGRAHVCTPVTNAHLVCRLLLEHKQKLQDTTTHHQTLM